MREKIVKQGIYGVFQIYGMVRDVSITPTRLIFASEFFRDSAKTNFRKWSL